MQSKETEKDSEKLYNKLKEHSQDGLIKTVIASVKEMGGLRKQLSERLEREKKLEEREKFVKKEEEKIAILRQQYIDDKSTFDSEKLEIKIQKDYLKKGQVSLEKLLNEVSNERAKIINDFTKKAEESYTVRIKTIENEISSKITEAQKSYDSIIEQAEKISKKIKDSAQIEYDSIIKQAHEIADKIRKDIQKEKDDIDELVNIKAKFEEKNIELGKKDKRINELIKEKIDIKDENEKLEEKCKELKRELEKIEKANEILLERIKSFKEYETLSKILKDANLSIEYTINSIKNLEQEKQNLQKEKKEFEKQQDLLNLKSRGLDNRSFVLDEREKKINEEVNDKVIEENGAREIELGSLRKRCAELQEAYQQQQDVVTLIDKLEMKLGENLQTGLFKIDAFNENMKQLEQEFDSLPSYMLKKKIEDVKQQEEELEQKRTELDRKIKEKQKDLEEVISLRAQYNDLQLDYDEKIRTIASLNEQLERFRSASTDSKDDRIKEIMKPCEEFENIPRLEVDPNEYSENEWLSNIKNKINQSGFYFPPRIIDAFHTALKTAEISPLTVLAGVSGTGKSKLPEYYARFGGINFLSVPVQPNWDCQESMTGFYNSIDNCFEPTQILRLLAQATRPPKSGLNDVMTMILLDEMNLANIELYFAEFLSKLETRRGHSDADIPSVSIKLGAKVPPYSLPLVRNVLWTGTMNQDETTKTLSDKVLDRGIVINFPRPKTFKPLPKKELITAQPLLPKSVWDHWVKVDKFDFSKNEDLKILLQKKKETVEKINEALGKVGRALGHRVWQSIEEYMSLYKEIHLAVGKKSLLCLACIITVFVKSFVEAFFLDGCGNFSL